MLPDSGPIKLPEEAATLNQHRSRSQEEAAPPADSWFTTNMKTLQLSHPAGVIAPKGACTGTAVTATGATGAHHVTAGGIYCWGCWRGGLAPGSTGRGDKLQKPSETLEPVVHRWAARTLEQRPRVTKACSGDGGTKVSTDQEEKTKVSSKSGAPGQPPQGGSCFIHQCQGNINRMDSRAAAAASRSSSKGRAWRSSAVCHPHLQQTSFSHQEKRGRQP